MEFHLPYKKAGKTILVETGFSRLILPELASVVRKAPNYILHSVDLDMKALTYARAFLEGDNLAPYCNFHLQDPIRYISEMNWIDAAFLNSSLGLEKTVDEFRQAASAGASLIVIGRFQSKAALAVEEAKAFGWNVKIEDDFSILERK